MHNRNMSHTLSVNHGIQSHNMTLDDHTRDMNHNMNQIINNHNKMIPNVHSPIKEIRNLLNQRDLMIFNIRNGDLTIRNSRIPIMTQNKRQPKNSIMPNGNRSLSPQQFNVHQLNLEIHITVMILRIGKRVEAIRLHLIRIDLKIVRKPEPRGAMKNQNLQKSVIKNLHIHRSVMKNRRHRIDVMTIRITRSDATKSRIT